MVEGWRPAESIPGVVVQWYGSGLLSRQGSGPCRFESCPLRLGFWRGDAVIMVKRPRCLVVSQEIPVRIRVITLGVKSVFDWAYPDRSGLQTYGKERQTLDLEVPGSRPGEGTSPRSSMKSFDKPFKLVRPFDSRYKTEDRRVSLADLDQRYGSGN